MTYAYVINDNIFEIETPDDLSPLTYYEIPALPPSDGFNVAVPTGLLLFDGQSVTRHFTWVNVQDKKISDLAAIRYEKERVGTTFNGMTIPTDDGTKANITAAYVLAVQNPTITRNWKVGPTTFMEFDANTIIAMGDAIQAHIQACFDHEKELQTQILAATTIEELDAVDITQGWPT